MSFYDLIFKDAAGDTINFGELRGKTCLLVNIATECGHARQLHDLQTLYLLYKQRGFLVLAFPSNDFGNQEPRGNEQIHSYCSSEYMVTFPVLEKSHVVGPEANEVFRFLKEQSRFPAIFGKPIWNFQKYLIDCNGNLTDVFLPTTSPRSGRFRRALERCLDTATVEKDEILRVV